MKIKYYIEFSEEVENIDFVEDSDELTRFTKELTKHLKKYISLAGASTDNFKLDFDIEE